MATNTFKNYVVPTVGTAVAGATSAASALVTALAATQTVIYSVSISNNLTTSITASAGLGKVATGTTTWLSRTAYTVTVTWPTTHGFSVGDWIVISGSGVASFDGAYQIATVSTTTFTYTSGTTGSTTSSIGTAYRMTYHVKDTPIAPGNSLVVLGADQKCNLNYSATTGLNDVYVVYTNTSIAASAVASVLEIT